MLSSKLFLIKNEFIKLNSETLLLGVFANIKDLLISCVPTANFWLNSLASNISIVAIDKFTLVIFAYFSTLYTTSFAFAKLHYLEHEVAIDNLISKSLYLLTSDPVLANSNIVLIIVKLGLLGIIINLIIAIIFRKRMRRRNTSKFYEQFEDGDVFNENYDRYTRSSMDMNPDSDYVEYKHNYNNYKISKLSQIFLYLHNIRSLNLVDINALLLDPALLSSQLGIRNLPRLELQDQMLKHLDIMTKNKPLDKNMRNLSEHLILNSKSHPLQDSLLTAKLLDGMVKAFPEFKQFINQANITIKDLVSLGNNFNNFVSGEIKNMKTSFEDLGNMLNNSMQQASRSDPLKQMMTDAKSFVTKLTKMYDSFSEKEVVTKGQKDEASSVYSTIPEKFNDTLASMSKQTLESIKCVNDFTAEVKSELKDNFKAQDQKDLDLPKQR